MKKIEMKLSEIKERKEEIFEEIIKDLTKAFNKASKKESFGIYIEEDFKYGDWSRQAIINNLKGVYNYGPYRYYLKDEKEKDLTIEFFKEKELNKFEEVLNKKFFDGNEFDYNKYIRYLKNYLNERNIELNIIE